MANVDELLSSLISDVHAYTGKDPLLPWLRYPSIPTLSLSLSIPLFSTSLFGFLTHSQLYLQRDPKGEGHASTQNPKGKTTRVLAEMRTYLRARSTLQKRHALSSDLAPSGKPSTFSLSFSDLKKWIREMKPKVFFYIIIIGLLDLANFTKG